MEAGDYRSEGPLEGGILKGAAVSVFAHVLGFVIAVSAPWPARPAKVHSPVCTVSLVSAGGGGNRGAAVNEADKEPAPAPQAELVKAPERTEPVKATVPVAPAPKKISKPLDSAKLKPRAIPVSQRRESRAMPEAPSAPVRQVDAEEGNAPGSPALGQGAGHGAGQGGQNAGSGSGAHSGPGAGGQGPYDAAFGSGDGPRFATRVLPRYPRTARELGKEGIVLLRLTIDENGRLVHAELVKKAGTGFDEEAMRAIRQSTFRPAVRNGKPVPCKAYLPIHFVLTDSDE